MPYWTRRRHLKRNIEKQLKIITNDKRSRTALTENSISNANFFQKTVKSIENENNLFGDEPSNFDDCLSDRMNIRSLESKKKKYQHVAVACRVRS